MGVRQPKSTGRLWLEALRRRWSLRLAAGERSWHFAGLVLRWLGHLPQQARWLREVEACPAMRQAAAADPRLYERWQQPCISSNFDAATRRRVIAAHYAFVQQRLPVRMRERLLRGQDVRLATLSLGSEAPVSLHLRKPAQAEAGELALLLLHGDRSVLAACALTFAGRAGLLLATLPQPLTAVAGEAARRAFLRGTHGLAPEPLLHALVRELAGLHELPCAHVGLAGRLEAAPIDVAAPPGDAQAFRHEACAAFLAAFHGRVRPLPGPAPATAALRQSARSSAISDNRLLASGP